MDAAHSECMVVPVAEPRAQFDHILRPCIQSIVARQRFPWLAERSGSPPAYPHLRTPLARWKHVPCAVGMAKEEE